MIRTDDLVVIIQARMTSKRLPGKVLADLSGRPVLEYMLKRINQSQHRFKVIVATTNNVSDNPIEQLCSGLGYEVFRGDEFDVLGRYYAAAKINHAKTIIRLTADCPMVDPNIIDEVINTYSQGNYDYVSNCNERTYPDGLDVEIFSFDALNEANQKAKSDFCREHVTPYIRGVYKEYESGIFKIGQVKFVSDFSHLRWTIDTIEDLKRVRNIVKYLPENYTWLDALSHTTKDSALLNDLLKNNFD